MSGLVPSMTKSTVFFGNVPDPVKQRIIGITHFEEGVLPMRYLGVPLISTRLLHKDCQRLVECMDARITDWKNKYLSFAGRLQLIRSVLSSMHIYWASVFILPKRIIYDLEQRMRRFLWSQGNNIKGKAKVKWKVVCLPKREGGLGIRRVMDMNNALMVAHIWSLLTHRESLWVRWIHSYRIRDRSFWDLPLTNNVTWSWRKILRLRPSIQNHVWTKLGDGTTTSLWFDTWNEVCPIRSLLTPRVIANAGFSMKAKVADVCVHGVWSWPTDWVARFHALHNIQGVILDSSIQDKLVWRTRLGLYNDYRTSIVWDDIRQVQNAVTWAEMVWFSQAIPRHSFFMWLLVNKKLKTQDMMRRWNTTGNLNLLCCSLCSYGPDSHEHLFFECLYASQVWNGVKDRAGMASVLNKWDMIFEYLLRIAESKKVNHVVAKLVVGAATYLIWQERNQRLFSNKKRSNNELVEVILTTVRLKLHTMRFKNSSYAIRLLQEWSLPRGLLIDEDDCG